MLLTMYVNIAYIVVIFITCGEDKKRRLDNTRSFMGCVINIVALWIVTIIYPDHVLSRENSRQVALNFNYGNF